MPEYKLNGMGPYTWPEFLSRLDDQLSMKLGIHPDYSDIPEGDLNTLGSELEMTLNELEDITGCNIDIGLTWEEV